MGKLKNKILRATSHFINKMSGGVNQEERKSKIGNGQVFQNMDELVLKAATEGAVLLENRENILPLKGKISVFGRVQIDYFNVGYGSGGEVIMPYCTNLIDSLIEAGADINEELVNIYREWTKKNPKIDGWWGNWPRFHEEMRLTDEIVGSAKQVSDVAVVVIGRAAGEDREHSLDKGGYYLTDLEEDMLSKVTKYFDKVVVVLDIGNVIDMNFVKKYNIGSVLLAWQGGMEAGRAVADLVLGKSTPSGKLPMIIAKSYDKYPSSSSFGAKEYNNYTEDIYVGYRYFETFAKDDVMYNFGYGLSYTNFDINHIEVVQDDCKIYIKANVTNIGDKYSGKEVIQVYLHKPQGLLGNPEKILTAFKKTELLAPKTAQSIELSFDIKDFASFDDKERNAYVLEKGEYSIYVGNNVRETNCVYKFTLNEDILVEQLKEVSAPKMPFDRIVPKVLNGNVVLSSEQVPLSTANLKQDILDNLPEEITIIGDKGYKLIDVKTGKISIEEFVAQLTVEELEDLCHGDIIMNSPLGSKGNAGAIGGVSKSLRDKGIRPIITTDGPSGIRLMATCTLMPIGTLLASSFNLDMVEALYTKTGEEMVARGSDILLAPGMNIQRNVLGGRNFEYFSEDPFLTGKMASAVVKGVQKAGVSACPKHFAVNSQETNRTHNDSRLSQRALREIYLKGFEICVKESKPLTIMTSYNKINGVWGHYNYDLCTNILRKEWGYKGMVMTDWWMRNAVSPEFENVKNNAYRIRSQVDVLMPGAKNPASKKYDRSAAPSLDKKEGLTISEMQRSAKNVLTMVLNFI